MLDGCTMEASNGSRETRFASSSARMSRSESSTGAPYRRLRAHHLLRQNGPVPDAFTSFVALGDSFTEGVGDPDPVRPNGVRGWADRVAEVLATRESGFRYANLAIRGRKMAAVL